MCPRLLSAVLQTAVFGQLAFGQPATVKRAIFDPTLNRNAFYVDVPSNWRFDGAILPGPSCETNPMAVFRASSPDGLSGVYVLPRVDWVWSSGPQQGGSVGDCPSWKQISARDYLTYLLPVLQVGLVRELDASKDLAASKSADDTFNAQNGPGRKRSSDSAEFLVRYDINGHPIEELLSVTISCLDTFYRMNGMHGYQCDAFARRMRAPLGRLKEQMQTLTSVRGAWDQQWNSQWMAAWAAAMRARVNGMYQAQTRALLAAGEAAGQARMQQHQAFMSSMQRQADARRSNFVQGQYNKQRANDNFVDYILDCTRLSNHVSVSGPSGMCQDRQTAPYPQ